MLFWNWVEKFANVSTERYSQCVQNAIPQIWPRSDNVDFHFLPTLFSRFDTPLECSIILAQIYANISSKNLFTSYVMVKKCQTP